MYKNLLIVLILMLLSFGGGYVIGDMEQTIVLSGVLERSLTDTVTYLCDNDRTIVAQYFTEGSNRSVDLILNGVPISTLPEVSTNEGTRYATADDSFAFWINGNQALVMKHNQMDLDFTNCTAK